MSCILGHEPFPSFVDSTTILCCCVGTNTMYPIISIFLLRNTKKWRRTPRLVPMLSTPHFPGAWQKVRTSLWYAPFPDRGQTNVADSNVHYCGTGATVWYLLQKAKCSVWWCWATRNCQSRCCSQRTKTAKDYGNMRAQNTMPTIIADGFPRRL